MPDERVGRRGEFSALGVSAAAAAWGLAEATLFFIVPDVLLTWLALDRPRTAWIACGWALAGAVAGGVAMYALGAGRAEETIALLERVPAVSTEMIDRVRRELTAHGLTAVFVGPLTGTPYKIYAVQSGALGVGLPLFVLASAPARLLRFAILTGLVALVGHRLLGRWRLAVRRAIHVALWAAFYTWYFWRFL